MSESTVSDTSHCPGQESSFRIMEAQTILYEQLKTKADAVISLEIGGMNGLQSK